MHTGAYSHHASGYPSFLSYAPTAQRKSDYGMSLHHPHHYLNDSIGTNTSSSSPSSNNSSAHLLSYSGYNAGLDLSSHSNNIKQLQSDDENDNQPLSPSIGDTTNGSLLSCKKRSRTVPTEEKDGAYFEKRARNNESAKRSRDSRRIKEQTIQERVMFLHNENSRLFMENQAIRYKISELHALHYGVSKPLQ